MNLVGPSDEVMMFEPFYTQYTNHIEFAGASIVPIPMVTSPNHEWCFDFKKFAESITPKTKLVVLTNPHNPSGKMFTEHEIKHVSEILDRHP
jgi:aspartate/methionine/tyrosine aminotransferase